MSTHFKGPIVSVNGFEGSLTGNIAGNVTGNVTGNLTGNVTGNVSGNQSGGSVDASTAKVGASGSTLSLIKKGTISVTVSALAAGDEEEYDLAIADAAVGDIVMMNPPAAAAEAGLAAVLCWVIGAGHVGLRVSNLNAAAALTGSTANWSYCLIR